MKKICQSGQLQARHVDVRPDPWCCLPQLRPRQCWRWQQRWEETGRLQSDPLSSSSHQQTRPSPTSSKTCVVRPIWARPRSVCLELGMLIVWLEWLTLIFSFFQMFRPQSIIWYGHPWKLENKIDWKQFLNDDVAVVGVKWRKQVGAAAVMFGSIFSKCSIQI